MDVLVSLAPVALIVLVCGGMHFLMMRGMHGGAAHGNAHDMHANQPAASGTADAERLKQLESEVASLREQVFASRKGTNGVAGSAAGRSVGR
jgi:Protein of unknown function (DUF2933).